MPGSARGFKALIGRRPEKVCASPPPRATLPPVDKHEQLRLQILQGKSDANIDFDDLRLLLRRLGFEERVRGSHRLFRRPGVRELINLQKEGNKARE